jgi:hypothetical protein
MCEEIDEPSKTQCARRTSLNRAAIFPTRNGRWWSGPATRRIRPLGLPWNRSAAAVLVAALCFFRREGYGLHDAQALTQAFFARLLEHDYINDVDPSRGRFRSFLLVSLWHFLANARDHDRAAKRGGGQTALSLNFSQAEDRYLHEPANDWTAEKLFHRRWAVEPLQAVMERLRAEWDTPENGCSSWRSRHFSVTPRQLAHTPKSPRTYR